MRPRRFAVPLHRLALILALAAAYFVTGKLGLLLALPPGYATAVWPPSGIALAALLLFGRSLWPGIVLGSFCVNLGTSFDPTSSESVARSMAFAATIGAGAALQAVVGERLIRRFVSWPLELVRDPDVGWFLALGGPVACTVNASVSALLLAATGAIPWSALPFTWFTWWTGDTIGVVVLAPWLLVLFGEPRAVWRRRRLTVAVPLAAVFTLAVLLFVRTSALEQDRIRLEFENRTAQVAEAVSREVDAALEVLHGIDSLYQTNGDVDAGTFRTFTARALQRHPAIHALSWNPLVDHARRAEAEAEAARDGHPGFRFTELADHGRRVLAAVRPEYVIVRHIEPRADNEAALGYDVFSEPTRREALQRARATGRLAATGPIRLVQVPGDPAGVLAFLPVYAWQAQDALDRGDVPTLVGFATGVFRVGRLVDAALLPVPTQGLALRLTDAAAAPGAPDLWRPHPGEGDDRRQTALLQAMRSFQVGGRLWRLESYSLPEYESVTRSWTAWAVLTAALLFTGLLGAFLLLLTGRAILTERFGAQRAADLSAANAALQEQIAERERAQQAAAASEAQLRQAQKLEAVGRLAGGVAHDFNNLVTAIIGYSNLVLETLAPEDPRHADVEEIRKAARRAAELTRQLLAFSRRQVLKLVVLDLNEAVRDMEAMVRRLIGEHIELETRLDDHLVPVRADPGQIQQVVLNLALNARDAMPEGGRIVVETRTVHLPAGALFPDGMAGTYARLSVTDTGTGMDEQTRGRIFEPFFTTKSVDKGTGLGLATVYGIVEQSGGRIEVDSTPGQGTTFRMYLAGVEGVADALPPPSQEAAPRSSPATILLVEDSPTLRRWMVRVLTGHGYAVVEAADGQHALEVAASHAGALDLVVSDMIMPRMGGAQLAERLRIAFPDVKVLFISGYSERAVEWQGNLGPGTAFLEKPFEPEALLAAVARLLSSPAAT